MGFFVTGNRGTLRGPPRCNATDACMKLYNGMKGIGTDEAAITAVVSVHNSKQRQQIRKKYSQVYKKDLLKELDGELSFGFGKLVAALMMDPEDYTLECIHKAVCQQSRGGKIVKRLSAMFKDGLGKTEYSILGLLFPRTNKQLEQIKAAFQAKYNLDLEERIAMGGNDLPQDLCTLLLDMLSGERQEDEEVDSDLVGEDTDGLVGASGFEDAFQEMMQERSFPHLRAVFDQYMEVTGRGIETLVEESEAFSLELKEAYKSMILLLTYEPEFYADRLRQAIQGAGTDDETLIRCIVLRSEVDMIDIVECYERKYDITLADDISGDTSGDYEDMLLKIITIPEEEKKNNIGARKAGMKRVAKKKAEVEEEEVEVKPITDVKQLRRVARSKAVKKAATPSPTPPEEDDAKVDDEESVLEKKKAARKAKSKSVKKTVSPPPEDEDVEVEDEESVVEKKKTARKAKAKSVKKAVTPPPEDENVEVEDEEPAVEKKKAARKGKSKAVKKAVTPPPEDEDAEVDEEEEPVEETKKVVRKTKPKIKKVASPPPEEEQQTEAEEDVEEEEEKPVVQKKKAVKKVVKPKAAPKQEEEEPQEEQEEEAVEEEIAAVETKDVEAAVVVDPVEEDIVAEVEEAAEVNDEKEGEDDTEVKEEEDEVKPAEETPEQDAKTEEEEGEPVVIVEEPEEESVPESTSNTAAKTGSEIEESVSPVISREL